MKGMHMKRKFVRATAVGALVVALSVVLAACGGDGDSEGVASLTDTTGQTTTNGDQGSDGNGSGASGEERRKAQLEFAKCMREHGVDMPDPKFEEGGGVTMRMPQGSENDPKVEEAQKACQPILDAAQPDGPPAQGEDS